MDIWASQISEIPNKKNWGVEEGATYTDQVFKLPRKHINNITTDTVIS